MMRPIFDRVVMATDLSPAWDQIAACGGQIRRLGFSGVILTYVITPNFFGGPGESMPPPAASRLAAQRRVLADQGLQRFHLAQVYLHKARLRGQRPPVPVAEVVQGQDLFALPKELLGDNATDVARSPRDQDSLAQRSCLLAAH